VRRDGGEVVDEVEEGDVEGVEHGGFVRRCKIFGKYKTVGGAATSRVSVSLCR